MMNKTAMVSTVIMATMLLISLITPVSAQLRSQRVKLVGEGTLTETASARALPWEPDPLVSPEDDPPVPAEGMLQVSGNRIVNSLGQTVYLRGTSKYGFENYPAGGSWGDTYLMYWDDWNTVEGRAAVERVLDAMKSWGVNAVRMPQAIDLWKQNLGSHREIIKELLVMMHERGLYLVYAPFLLAGTEAGYIREDLPYPPKGYVSGVIESEQDFINYIASIASELKDYPNVIFEFWNEPSSGSWDEYLTADFNSWKSVTQRCIDAVRATGAQQLIVVQWWYGSSVNLAYPDSPSSTRGLEWVTAMNPIDPLNNIVISTHMYRGWGAFYYQSGGAKTHAWTRDDILIAFDAFGFDEVASNYPLLISEIGCNMDAPDVANELSAWDTCLDILNERGYHYLSWWFSEVTAYREHYDESSGFAPNESGKILKRYLGESSGFAPNESGKILKRYLGESSGFAPNESGKTVKRYLGESSGFAPNESGKTVKRHLRRVKRVYPVRLQVTEWNALALISRSG